MIVTVYTKHGVKFGRMSESSAELYCFVNVGSYYKLELA